ncbi:MAG: hypothetical protein JWQ00_3176 [Noviherbaspirillum sp.]|nr:hypothetical protein [Noviherbaspirillum sp.]
MKTLSLKSPLSYAFSLLALAALAACGGGDDGTIDPIPLVFTTTLNSAEETPPNNSPAEGIGVLILHPADNSFNASVITSGMQENAAHIHEAPPGVPGPIIFPMAKEPGSVEWKVNGTFTAEQLATLRAGNYYFNVHSPTFPGCEIRGQIRQRSLTPEQQQRLQEFLQSAQQSAQQAATAAAAGQVNARLAGTSVTGTASSR